MTAADDSVLEGLLESTPCITYAWLARELCVPAAQARALLAAYAARHAVAALYLVCGTARAPDAPYHVSIVPASGLDGA
jgi:hypothetical protein